MRHTVDAAEAGFSDLIDAALAGEEAVIVGERGAVRMVPIPAPVKRTFRFGLLQGQFGTGPDFLDAMGCGCGKGGAMARPDGKAAPAGYRRAGRLTGGAA